MSKKRFIKLELVKKGKEDNLIISTSGLASYEIIGLCRKLILQMEFKQVAEFNEGL